MYSQELALHCRRSKWVSQLQGSWLKVTPNNLSAGFITIEGNASGTCLVVLPLNTISEVLLRLSFILFLQAYCWIFPTLHCSKIASIPQLNHSPPTELTFPRFPLSAIDTFVISDNLNDAKKAILQTLEVDENSNNSIESATREQ